MTNIFDLFDKIKLNGSARQSSIEFLIVGLGNPGKKYEHTRHNAGFLVIDALAEKFDVPMKRVKFQSVTGEGMIGGKKCLLMKPNTFMNLSGEAVYQAMEYFHLSPEQLLVIYDDISLEPSKLRIRRKGSHGGHNGIRNIIDMIGDETFARIKLGVGKKPNPRYDLADWVLSTFTQKEQELMIEAAKKAAEAAELIVSGKIDQAMNQFNS